MKIIPAYAQDKVLTYTLTERDRTQINYNIELTNDDPYSYIASYTLSTGVANISNLQASLDGGGQLSTSIFNDASGKVIEVRFPQSTARRTSYWFTLSFSTEELTDIVGNTTELLIPGFDTQDDFKTIVQIPNDFGQVNFLSKQPTSKEVKENETLFIYFGDQKNSDGLFLSVGDVQYFDFSYTYEIKNEKDSKSRATITLPPDTEYQKVYFSSITPTPNDGEIDSDGNYSAIYILASNSTINVEIKGKIAIYAGARGYRTQVPADDLTAESKYWETTDAEMIRLAKDLTNEADSVTKKAKAIYDYVVKTLSYDTTDPENIIRFGAKRALANPNNVKCQEYSDLFITIARAAGIPARMLVGYTTAGQGYDLPDNTLHAWVEFYNEEGIWKPIDPTWASTTEGQDFFTGPDDVYTSSGVGLNHIVMAIRGANSETPAIILSFSSDDSGDDNINFTPTMTAPDKSFDKMDSIKVELAESNDSNIHSLNPWIQNKEIVITNEGYLVIAPDTLTITGDGANYTIDKDTYKNKIILPGMGIRVNMKVLPEKFFSNYEVQSTILLEFKAAGEDGDGFQSVVSLTLNIPKSVLLLCGIFFIGATVVFGGFGILIYKTRKNRSPIT